MAKATVEKEATIVTFRLHTLLLLYVCPYALQAKIPHITGHHYIAAFSAMASDACQMSEAVRYKKRRFKAYLIGFFHIDIAEVQTAEGKLYLVVDIDRTSKSTFVD